MIRRLKWRTIKRFIQIQFAKQNKSSLHFALSAGFGVFMSVLPIWGFQLITALALAHFLKLNKALVFIGVNITIPPVIPFVLYISFKTGGWFVQKPTTSVALDSISLEFVKTNFIQYLAGSLFIATVAGTVVLLLVWLIVAIRRK